ncbi:hypothetical protein ACF0H5_000940 [Mactra antiquata]
MAEVEEKRERNNELNPDKILEDLGGCGMYQIKMAVIIHLIKTIFNFTSNSLVIFTATPKWFCSSEDTRRNISTCFQEFHGNNESISVCEHTKEQCYMSNTSQANCNSFEFDGNFRTIVSQFNLVCDRAFIPSTINSIHIAGILVGNLLGGQLADLYGRKPSFYSSIVLLMLFNLLAYFSPSWEVFTAATFFTGVGCGIFLTLQFTILTEYSLSRHRVWMVGFPSWPLQTSLLALCSYALHDWKYIQLMSVLMTIPAMMTWWLIPESFRWYVGHDNIKEAQKIITNVAKVNKKDVSITVEGFSRESDKRKYYFLHLFKTRRLVKITLLLMLNWAALDIVSYGIYFGIQILSGSIYLNMFLFALVGIPTKFFTIYLQNRIGRRCTVLLCYVSIASACISVGIILTVEPVNKDRLTNGFAMIASASVAAVWGPLQTMTLEMYPTVIRNIGFGSLSVIGKISAVIGPQLVYLDSFAPGLLFYTCGGLAALSSVGTLLLPETKDLGLQDKIETVDKDNDKNVNERNETAALVDPELKRMSNDGEEKSTLI